MCSFIFVGKMCVFVSRPMTIVTFLRKNDYLPKRVVYFPLERDTFRNKIMEIVEDFEEKSYNRGGVVVVVVVCGCGVLLCAVVVCGCCYVVAIVVVSDAYESVCMITAPHECTDLPANSTRANLETWACTKPRELPNPCPDLSRIIFPIILITTPPLVIRNGNIEKSHMTQPLPNPWTGLNHKPREVCRSFSV